MTTADFALVLVFGMLFDSSYRCISHSFCFISPGWKTLLVPCIRHITFVYARKSAACVTNRICAVYNQMLGWHQSITGTCYIIWCWSLIGTWVTVCLSRYFVWECWLQKRDWDGSWTNHMGVVRQVWRTISFVAEGGLVCHDCIALIVYLMLGVQLKLRCVRSYWSFLTHNMVKGIA